MKENTKRAAEDWGWKVHCGRLMLETMDCKPVPDVMSKSIYTVQMQAIL